MLKGFIKIYFGIGSVLGLLNGLSYIFMPWKLAFDGCYGLVGFVTAQVWGVVLSFIGFVTKLFLWPYGLYNTYVYDLGYLKWIFTGFFAGCNSA